MLNRMILAAAIMMAALLPPVARAEVKVSASRDISSRDFRWAGEREATIGELQRHLQRLGDRYLAPGQSLSIELRSIELAGDIHPMRRDLSDFRVLTNATPPRITLRYALRQKGRIVRQATETVSDPDYRVGGGARSPDRLAYEKQMLSDWFAQRFGRSRS